MPQKSTNLNLKLAAADDYDDEDEDDNSCCTVNDEDDANKTMLTATYSSNSSTHSFLPNIFFNPTPSRSRGDLLLRQCVIKVAPNALYLPK